MGLARYGLLVVIGRAPDGSLGLMSRVSPDGNWSSWVDLGSVVAGAPAVMQNADGRLEVLAVGEDGRLGHLWQAEPRADSGWWDWQPLGPVIKGAPAVFSNADGRHEAFAIGPDGRLGHAWQHHPDGLDGWSAWEDLGPVITSSPTVSQNGDGRLEVFAAGPRGRLGHRWQLDRNGHGGWSDWEDLGPVISGEPVLSQNVDAHLEVFAAGPDGLLGHTWQIGAGYGWSEWEDLGPAITGRPATCQNTDARLEVFAARTDGRLGHTWQLGPATGWSDWEDLGPVVSGDPAVSQNGHGGLEVFAPGADGLLGHAWQLERGRGWSGWEQLDPSVQAQGLTVALCLFRHADLGGGLRSAAPVTRRRPRFRLGRSGVLKPDVCVIGGGPAGITVSEGLVKAGASVVLAESGHLEDDPAAQELNNGIVHGAIVKDYWRYLRNGRRRSVGGSTLIWGRGWCLPFRALDFEHRPWMAYSGWPLTSADISPYEAMAASTLGFEPFEPPRPDGPLVRQTYHYPPDPQVFRRTFTDLLARPRFRAELGSTAVELTFRRDRVTNVRLARADGGEQQVAPGTVILAAGGIENARLLLLHEGALPSGEMVGRCFMEHPHVLAGLVELPHTEALRECLEGNGKLDVLALGDGAQHANRLHNATVQLRRRHTEGDVADGLECDLYVRAEQAPNPESRVRLGDRVDRLGLPWPILQWQPVERDWQSIVRTAQVVGSALEKEHDAVFQSWIRPGKAWPMTPAGPADSSDAAWGFHHMGTTRMAAAPSDGVVDSNSLVFGTENLYVAGSSVFPTGGAANPTFMIVALAHRLAEHLNAPRSRTP